MAFQSLWYFSDLPEKFVDLIVEDVKQYDGSFEESKLYNGESDEKIRKSKNTWIPGSSWVSGFLWHYVNLANRENFLYDIETFDHSNLQYTSYSEGEYYGWHSDHSIANSYALSNESVQDFINVGIEKVRKLSIVMQLSSPEEYDGGNMQIINDCGKSYFLPRKRGTIVVFDSRANHRVTKVTRGVRKSIVGWVVGPRWK